MAQLCHWPVPCTICESPVEYHCNTCGDVLCSKCRDNHLKSNATKHHEVVPYSQRTESNKSSLQCGDHPGHQCGVWCQTCNRGICGDCVTSAKHRGHHFLKFDKKIKERRKVVQRQFDRYSKILSDWQTTLKETEIMKETYEKNIMQVDKEIVDRADELCKQVREVEKESREQLQKIRDSSLRRLQDQQKTLADGIQSLKEKVKETEETLRSTDSSTILEYSIAEQNMPEKTPSIDVLSPVPVFTTGSMHIQILKDLHGSLSGEMIENIESTENKVEWSLLINTSVESVIYMEKDSHARAIVCVGSDQAWVKTGPGRLQLMDKKGKVERTVSIDFKILDMAVTPQGNILLPDHDNMCTRSMTMDGKIKPLFDTQWKPHCICCLPSGEMVVGFRDDNRIVRYNSGGIIMEQFDGSLFQCPKHVAYSKVNQQLVVCDKSKPKILNSLGRVLVLNMDGELQHTYTGTYTATFTPAGVCTDLAGHVLITDIDNNRVHILDKGGNFNQYLLTDEEGLTKPSTIDVDSGGYVWIGEHETWKVKVVKYADKK